MWENLKSTVNNVIRPNDNREITGEKHNNTLSAVINSLGKYSQFAGLAFKNTNPGVPDGPVFYFAAFKGVYINFNRIEVEENEVAILNYNNNKWEKIVIGYSPIAPATIEDIRLTTLIDAVNSNNALKTNFEFKQDSILGVQLPFLHAAISHIDADGQLIKGKPTSETLILVPLAEASTDADTPGKHGFMSYQDKDLLDSIPNYTISGKKISENPILTYDDIQGVAYLGEDGKIPSSLLPSYVDDVLEYDSIDNFPLIGEGGKIYLDKKTNLAYRWSGTVYVSISSSIALGETSSTAYAGDKGKKNADDIADLKANKADKTSVYTKEEVDYLIEHFKLPDHIKAITFSVDGILVSKNEDGNLVIGGNVIVEGGISMYGPGQFSDTIMDYIVVDGTSIKIIDGKLTVDPDFVGGGTVKGIKVNGYTYDEVDANGYITIPDYPTELAWNSITGKPSTFTPSAHTHKIEDITDIADASVSHATTADRLKKEIMIWGQPFDGSTDVEGAISNVDVINMANADTVISLYIKNGVLFIEGDLAVTGGITMYASNGVTSGMIDQVYAVLDPAIFSKQGDYITIKGDIGGGTVKAVKVGSTQYDPDSNGIISLPDYPTVTTLEWDNILNKPSSFIPSAHTHAISDITNLQATLDGKAAVSHTHSYLPLSGGSMAGTIDCQALSSTVSAIKFRGGGTWDSGIGHDTAGNETLFLWAKTSVTRLRWHAGIDFSTFSAGSVMNITPDFEISKASGSAVGYIAGQTIIHSGNISAQSVNYASSSGNADTVDGYHASSFAFQGSHNNLMASGNEFTFASNGYSGAIYINYRTAGGTNGNITQYILYNGSGGHLGEIIHTGNYSSYCAPASHTHSYLPLSGGTMSGNIDIQNMDIIGYGGAQILQNLSGNLGINPSGNVGIGTTVPGYKLTVSGTLGVTGSVTFSGLVEGTSDCTDNTEILTSYASNNGFADSNSPGVVHRRDALCMYNYVRSKFLGQGGTFSGSVGFAGSTYYGNVLYIQGNQINLNTNSAILYNPSTTPAGFTMPSNDCDVLICTRLPSGGDEGGVVVGSDVCVIYNSADEGAILKVIDKDVNSDLSQSYTGSSCYLWVGQDKWCRAKYLYASGDILAGGGITMYSDLRKKNILSDEVLSVKEIAAAPLFAHTYKSDENHYLHIGTSAQYWSAIHEGWFTRKDSEGYYQMELQNLGVAMGISLAREIVKYESKTDKKIRLMKKKINDLEARIKELEGSREERRTA